MDTKIKVLFLFAIVLTLTSCGNQITNIQKENSSLDYLADVKKEFTKKWPNNRTLNLVFHGHSVPAGYFKTPEVNTLDSYPFQVLKKLKEQYPFAVINVIISSIGGENSVKGSKRFESEVLNYKPDLLFIDYALNDRAIGLEESKKAWVKMIEKSQRKGIKIILLTPSPDLKVNFSEKNNILENHANQIKALAEKYKIGVADSYSKFKEIKKDCDCLNYYMSQSNHPNAKGHSVIAEEILKFF